MTPMEALGAIAIHQGGFGLKPPKRKGSRRTALPWHLVVGPKDLNEVTLGDAASSVTRGQGQGQGQGQSQGQGLSQGQGQGLSQGQWQGQGRGEPLPSRTVQPGGTMGIQETGPMWYLLKSKRPVRGFAAV